MTHNELRLKRITAKVSQHTLARRLTKLGFKVTQSTIHSLEIGKRQFDPENRHKKLVELLDEALSEPGPDSISNKGGPAFWKQ